MPDRVFPLDYLYPLVYIKSAQTFIRDSWIAFNNDALQVFERGTGIVTRVAPNILDLMSATSCPTIPTGPSVITHWISPGPNLETITRSGCKKWCDMQLNACEAELDWTTGFALVLFIILIALILILILFCCCCRRAKTGDKETGTDPEPESKPVDTTGIEDMQKRLDRRQNDCDEEKAILRDRFAQQEKRRDEEKASLQRQLSQQQEECEEEKLELRREVVQAGIDNGILKLKLQAAGPAATATDKADLIDAQLDQLKGQRTMLEAERGRYLRLIKKNAGLQQDQVKSAQQVDKLQRDLAEVKRQRLAEGQECEEEKQRLDEEVRTAHKQLQLAQHDTFTLLGQIDALEKSATRPNATDQSTQTEKKTKDQGSQTQKKMKDQTTQTLVGQQRQKTASVANQTGTIAGTAPAPQAPSIQDKIFDDNRMKRLERENLRLQNLYDTARADAARVDRENTLLQRQYDTARSDAARLRRAHEGHGKYQKTLEDLMASSKIVEQNVREINQRCPHSHKVCEPRGVVNSTRSRHSSQQDSEQNLSGKEDVDEEEQPDCDSTRCHECAQYAGEEDHICVKSNDKVPITENNPVSKIQAGEEDESEIEDKHEDEEDEVEAPKPPLVSRVPKLGPPPIISYPSPPLPPKISPIPLKPEIPSITAIDFLTKRMSELPVPPSGAAEFEGRQRLKELRATFRAEYEAFQENARRTTCSGRRHLKKLEYAADARSSSRNKIDSKTWAPNFDFEDFQKRCKEGLQTWAEGHAQDRRHLPKQCSQEDIENANDCLLADPVEPAVDFDSEEEIERKAVANGPDANESFEDDLDSLFGSSGEEATIPEQSPTNANSRDNQKTDKATPKYENTVTNSMGKPPLSAPSNQEDDPKAVIGEIERVTPMSGAGPCSKQATVSPTGQSEELKAPTKPSSDQANPESAASNVLSTVSPTPKADNGVGTSDQSSGKEPTGAAPTAQKPTDPPPPTFDTPLVPPNLPLPFQESSPDAILKYEAERGHEFTRLPTSGSGFLCGVNAVELTTAHMHPEIKGLTAAALMEVLDWQEYRDIVADSRFAYRNDLGELVSPTNREFFAVDQLASMIGLWGSRRGLDLRLGVNREDYGPSVYGGVREGRTVILWIHHDNNEERTRDLFFPMVDHFSGYKRVPADTIDEAHAKQEAADKQAQDLREAEEQSRRDAEVMQIQDAKEQSKKDAEAKSHQSLQEAQDKKNTPTVPLLFGKYTHYVDFAGGFKPPPPPAVVKKPTIDWATFELPPVNFNRPDESSNIKDSGKITAEEADKKLAKEAAEKARQAAVSQTLENARRAENGLRAKQEAQKQKQEAAAEAGRVVRENEQLKRQTEEKAQQKRIALAGASNARQPDQDMADAPTAKPDDVDMKEDSDSSDLSEMLGEKVNALINFNNSARMDVDEHEETRMTDKPTTAQDPEGDDWSKLSDAAFQRQVLENQAQSPTYPPPSKPWHLMSPVGTNPSPGFISGVTTPALTGIITPRAPVTSPPFVPQNVNGAENQQHKKPTQGKYNMAQKPPKKDEYVFPPTPKNDAKPSSSKESVDSSGAQIKDLRTD